MASDFVASRPVTAGSRPVRTASTKSAICRVWNGVSAALISERGRSAPSPAPNGEVSASAPGTAQTSLRPSVPSGYSASPTVPPGPVTSTRVPSARGTAVEAEIVASPPEANLSVATAVSSTSMGCVTVRCVALTSTQSPMNHWSRST